MKLFKATTTGTYEGRHEILTEWFHAETAEDALKQLDQWRFVGEIPDDFTSVMEVCNPDGTGPIENLP